MVNASSISSGSTPKTNCKGAVISAVGVTIRSIRPMASKSCPRVRVDLPHEKQCAIKGSRRAVSGPM